MPSARRVIGADHRMPYGYKLSWNGVKRLGEVKSKDGVEIVEIPVCDRPVVIKSILDRVDGAGSLFELAFRTHDTGDWLTVTAPRDVAMTARLLTGLALHRFPVNSGNSSHLVDYLVRYETANEKVIARKKAAVQMGWQGEKREFGFLVGRRQILPPGKKARAVEFASDSDGDTLLAESFRQGGTAEAWMNALLTVTQYPRVYLAVLASLAAPLLDLLELDNFFVDYSGETSGGKTTTLRIAASVWGSASHRKYSLLRSWNTTVAGMERTASTLSGLPLFVDESNEAQSPLERQALAKMVYQLGNGRGRTRATRSSGTQPLRHWSTIVLSSREHPITTATQDAGTRARVLAMEDSPFGGVSRTTSTHVRVLNAAVASNYGHAGPIFMTWVMARLDQVPAWVARHRQLAASYASDPKVPEGVAERLGRHLALLDLTGELMAEAFGLPLGYQSPVRTCLPQVTESAQQVDRPKEALLDLVSRVYATSSRLFGESNHDPTLGVIGKRMVTCDGIACLAVTGAFVREVLMELGHNPYRITRSWLTRGYLVPGGDGKHQRIVKLGGPVRCSCIRLTTIKTLFAWH